MNFLRLVLALLLAAHAIAHFVGVREAFWPGPIQPRRLVNLPRLLDGLVWLVLGVGFMGISALVLTGESNWRELLLGAAGASLLMCVTAWPSARFGVVIDAVLLLLTLLLVPTSISS